MISILALNRYQASFMHLLASIGVVGLVAALVFLLWYPGLLAYASGVYEIFVLLLLVDWVLGPLITLIIFNPKKRELKRDMMFVVLIQLGALFYGVVVLFLARPVYLVFNADRFDVVYANEITKEDLLAVTKPEFKRLPLFGPKVIGARLPENEQEARDIVLAAVSGGRDVQNIPEYYVEYDEIEQDVKQQLRGLDQLRRLNGENIQSELDEFIGLCASKCDEIGYIPLIGRAHDLTVFVDANNSKILKISKLKPLGGIFARDVKK